MPRSVSYTAPENFTLTSPAFDHGASIPEKPRGRLLGANISPTLNWTQPPAGTVELVLIVQDPDVPIGKPATHALTLGIDPSLNGIPENAPPTPALSQVPEIGALGLAEHRDTGYMPFRAPPSTASWQHREARSGFEVAYFQAAESGWIIDGTTAAVEDGQTWVVTYSIELDAAWVTRSARIGARTVSGSRETRLESDGCGRWLINGAPAPDLNGCVDVDLESSAMTNTLPVHRLDLPAGAQAAAPAAYVRALDLTVERLEQTYLRIADQGSHHRYNYSAPAFGFTSCLVYDENGLVIDYPGIALRAR